MRARRLILIVAMAALLAACNLSVPQVTPTVAPTRTPGITPSGQFTATASLTPSRTPSATPLPTRIAQQLASETPTRAPSETSTATVTLTLTATLTLTRTPLPSFTPTSTSTATPTVTLPTPTPLPTIGPTDTPTMTRPPTLTPLPTLTDTPAMPLPTFTRTLSPTEIALALGTFAPTATSAAPTASPTRTLAPPTLDATPTFVTAEAGTPPANVPPVLNTSEPAVLAPTETAQPEAALPTSTANPSSAQIPGFQPNLNQLQAFALGGSGGAPFTLLNNVNVVLFERNPLNPAQYAVTDSSGLLYFTGVNGQNASRPDVSPFSRFLPLSRDENNAYVSDIAWSPDGRFLAFLVDGDKEANDGVWFFGPNLPDTFAPIQLLVDCHKPGHPGCAIVTRPAGPDLWESLSLQWSPTSDALLVRTELPLAGRTGLTVVPFSRDERARDVRPPALLYEYGSWENNGNRILVSGRGPDDNVYIGWVNRDGSFNELVFAARDAGLWVQNAVQRPDGSIVTLGAPLGEGGPNGVMRLYNVSGQALTGAIGNGPPTRVEWSPDRSAVLVAAAGRFYLATVNGTVNDITDQVGGAQAINWVDGSLPVGEPLPAAPETDFAPIGQASGSSQPFAAGANLRVINTTGCLNLRDAPNTGAQVIACLAVGEPVQVSDGTPVREDGVVWWPVQALVSGLRGWIAGEIDGVPRIGL